MTQFYQITLEKAIADYRLGKLTTFGLVDYYLKIKFAPGWKISIDPRKAIEELGITIHQFRRAIAKIKETIAINLKTTFQIVGEMPAENGNTPNVNRVTPRVNEVTPGVNHVTPSANRDRQTPNKNKASSDSPDTRSNTNHIPLSKIEQIPAEEREKFLIFANQKVDELPTRPTLPKRWITANFDELYSEWKKQAVPEVQKATKDKRFAEWYDLMHQLGHVTGQRTENGVQLVQVVGTGWIEYERKAKSWTLEYLKKCVSGK
ncbi:hypothetical protein Xen7305DRAFT_00005800 [Xenococcus sp. PCC 7305]|uniref:hypothetical protein n=1 Tax=Xenococcus sp. PCC 7305 TaxID=102125 RepID=UPI0002ABB760|nr:hypothetical protein [Xenococcus sp. PCC 7305]ELS00879.1 hypothetical protein Xen7305DRAFT_00005800 [Xenococcus sp. PCC 7305]